MQSGLSSGQRSAAVRIRCSARGRCASGTLNSRSTRSCRPAVTCGRHSNAATAPRTTTACAHCGEAGKGDAKKGTASPPHLEPVGVLPRLGRAVELLRLGAQAQCVLPAEHARVCCSLSLSAHWCAAPFLLSAVHVRGGAAGAHRVSTARQNSGVSSKGTAPGAAAAAAAAGGAAAAPAHPGGRASAPSAEKALGPSGGRKAILSAAQAAAALLFCLLLAAERTPVCLGPASRCQRERPARRNCLQH